MVIIREIDILDAEKLSTLIQKVESSSEFMLWESGERTVKSDQQKEVIERMKVSGNSTILVAENNHKELVGYLFAMGGHVKRNRHSAYIVVGISEKYRGQGVGTKLFNQLDAWAIRHSVHRLELTVVTRNEAGLSLYKKMGFEIEGTKRHALFINNAFVDEYYMSKLLKLS